MTIDWPASGSIALSRQVWTMASPVGRETIGVRFSTLPENATERSSRMSPRIGVLKRTLNSPGASSSIAR